MSKGEEELAGQFDLAGIEYRREAVLIPGRRFRVDFWLPPHLCVEVEGIVWQGKGGRHQRGAGMEKDMEKYNLLALPGFRLLRFSPGMIRKGIALAQITEFLTLMK
jgi:very-short-patch-repair endonuclease